MCAIAGIYETAGRPVEGALLRSMTRRQAHRGPDGEGYVYLDPAGSAPPRTDPEGRVRGGLPFSLALGHRRLAVLDLSPAGGQPMPLDGGRYWISYNGELYNYVELRDLLAAMGRRFRSLSDTEVLLAAYAAWGDACLARLNGMFAFAIWDAGRRRLFCARDRLGEKPLYYRWDGQRFAFASEIKGVLPAGGAVTANDRAVFDYLDGAVLDAGEDTFFAGVKQLPPAHALVVEHETVRVCRYWSLPGETEGDAPSFDRAAQGLRELLHDAVRIRLRSDVPVGSCLSGGLDSSSIVCVASALRSQDAPLQTFSSCFEDPVYDERAYVLPVVAQTRSVAHYAFPDPKDLLAQVQRLIWHQDEPFGSTSIFAQWTVMRVARQHGAKVLLDGQGADELLAGYPRLFGVWFAELLRRGELARLVGELRAWHRMHRVPSRELVAAFARGLLPHQLVRAVRSRMTGSARWLAVDFRRRWRSAEHLEEPGPSSLRAVERGLLTGNGLRALLRYEDRNAMAFGVETRLPFLDHRLVEFLHGLEPAYKLHAGRTKLILREAMRGLLPEPVRLRADKMGFVTPESEWLRSSLRPFARDVLSDGRTRGRGYLDAAAALRAFEAHTTGRANLGREIWRWLNLELWCRRFLDEAPCDGSWS